MVLAADRSGTYFKSLSGQSDNVSNYLPIATGQLIFQGALVSVNAAGFLIEAGDTANTVFKGIAVQGTGGVTTGANGELSTQIIEKGVVLLNYTGATQAQVGDLAYIVDDDTVAAAGTTAQDVLCGRVHQLGPRANTVWVAFDTNVLTLVGGATV